MAYDNMVGIIHELGHREFVGGNWDVLGPLQLDFLKAQGLRPSDCFIDIACGSLRGGVHLIRYLDQGNYHGIDKFIELIIYGVGAELSVETYREKTPRFVVNDVFDFSQFQARFTFGVAQSIFTHLTRQDAHLCLSNLAPHAARGCRLFCTFFETDAPTSNPDRSHTAMRFNYTRDEMSEIGHRAGWDAKYIGDWGHPREQMMMEMVRE